MECCGDHHDAVAAAIERAADLIEQAMRGLPREAVLGVLERLAATDDYGTRQRLAAVVRSPAAARSPASGERPDPE
jgi:hypothetical protein